VVPDPGEPSAPRAARRLNEPRRVLVSAGDDGVPAAVDRVAVAGVREEWRVADRWWTAAPVQRRYFELVLETGRNVVVYLDEERGRWFRQSA
jgi:hypothetical protein